MQQFREINLRLAGRDYPVSVLPEEEATLKQLAKELDEKFEALRQTYRSRLLAQDLLAMMLLTQAQELHALKQNQGAGPMPSLTNLALSLERLDTLLDELLPLTDNTSTKD